VKFNAITPLVVNSAFTCELYLKALGLITGSNALKGHDLVKLLNAQSPDVKNEIYQRYDRLYQARDTLPELKQPLSRASFDAAIEEVKSAFVDWRYAHERESESIRPAILRYLRLALRHTVSNRYDSAWFD
jgi:HEPN domain-containing protein